MAAWSQSDCVSGCSLWDLTFSNAYFNYGPAEGSNLGVQAVSNICNYLGAGGYNLQNLNVCVVCNVDGLSANHNLQFYQEWDIFCNANAVQGAGALSSLLADSDDQLTSMFTATYLPQISALLNGETTTLAPPITTSTMGPAASGSSAPAPLQPSSCSAGTTSCNGATRGAGGHFINVGAGAGAWVLVGSLLCGLLAFGL